MRGELGMCLLHSDYHDMEAACWEALADWYFSDRERLGAGSRDRYQLAVEQRMLAQLTASPVA